MHLYPLDTFAYEFPGKEIKIDFEIPEFTCVCPSQTFRILPRFDSNTFPTNAALS